MEDIKIINLTPENIADYGVCGYKDVQKHRELENKIKWFKEYYPKGLRIKAVYNGKVISHHPISNGRFENIMSKLTE